MQWEMMNITAFLPRGHACPCWPPSTAALTGCHRITRAPGPRHSAQETLASSADPAAGLCSRRQYITRASVLASGASQDAGHSTAFAGALAWASKPQGPRPGARAATRSRVLSARSFPGAGGSTTGQNVQKGGQARPVTTREAGVARSWSRHRAQGGFQRCAPAASRWPGSRGGFPPGARCCSLQGSSSPAVFELRPL